MSFRFPRAARPALAAALAASSSVAVCRADLAGIEHGRIGVVQLDNGNGRVIEGPSSIALTRDGGSRGFSIVGGNRADYTVAFGNDDDTAAGVMLTSVRQNGRDNTAGGGPGLSYATAAAEEAGEDRPDFPVGRYYIATSAARGGDAGSGSEFNIDVAAGHFRFDSYLGGVAANATNGGPLTELRASAGINLGTQFIDNGDGTSVVDLRDLGGDSRNGVLLVTGAKNEDNFTMSRANDDGTFSLFNHDNGVDGAVYEQDPVGFVFLDAADPGDLTFGRILGDATAAVSAGLFDVTGLGVGQFFLEIAGQTAQTGTLLISAAGGGLLNVDNFVSYEASGNGWIVQTRDIPEGADPAMLEDLGTEEAFSFVFLADPAAVPEPGTLALIGAAGLGGLLRRRRRPAAA